MKCPSCKEGKMTLEVYRTAKIHAGKHLKQYGKFVCDNCGHIEVFQ